MTETTPPLPGLDLTTSGGHAPGAMRTAAVATLEALAAAELLEPRHTLTCQTVLSLSAAIDNGLSYGKVSVATSTLVRHLLDAIDSLPAPVESAVDDAFAQLVDELKGAG